VVKALGLVQNGAHPQLAAAAAEALPQDLARVSALVQRLEAGHEFNLMRMVDRAAERDWRAAAWLLERRYPERWARREHTADPIELLQTLGNDEKALAWMREVMPKLEARIAAKALSVPRAIAMIDAAPDSTRPLERAGEGEQLVARPRRNGRTPP
jgi:hypothetical protein